MDNKPTIPGIPTPPSTLPKPANTPPVIPPVNPLPGPVDLPPITPATKEEPTPVAEAEKKEEVTATSTDIPSEKTPVTLGIPNIPTSPFSTPGGELSPTLAPTPSTIEEKKEETKDVVMPKGGKKKVLPAIMAVVALFVVAGIAGAAYYVSNQLSSRQAIAPNAPESKPMAGGECSGDYGNCGSSYCVAGTCVKTCCKKGANGYNCSLYGNCFTSADGCSGCGGSGSSSGGGPSCGAGSSDGKACSTGTAGGANNCPTSPYNFGCGTQCCLNNRAVCCCTGCYPNGTDCSKHSCNNPDTCDSGKRDAPYTKTLTFSKAGTVNIFTMNGGAGTITFTGPKTVTANISGGGASQNATTFAVSAGETYTIKVKFNSESKDAYGYIKNKAATTCGPSNAICGGNLDIAPLVSLAASKSDVSGITAGGQPANTQCWGDAELGDATQDYDYNDFALILGYSGVRQDYCASATIDKSSLTAGQSVKITSNSNTDVNGFYYVAYNLDNLYGPGNPKPICVGTGTDAQCPSGGSPLIFSDPDKTTKRKTGSVTIPYESLFVTDKQTNQVVKNVQFNSYFSLDNGPWSLPKGECVVKTAAGQLSCADLVNQSVTPTSGNAGFTATVVCDFGRNVNCVRPSGWANCTFKSANGTALTFECTAPNASFTSKCSLFQTPECGVAPAICEQKSVPVTINTIAGPACTQVEGAVKDSTGKWNRIKKEDIAKNVKMSDTIRLLAIGNNTTTKVRFKVVGPDGKAVFTPEWKDGLQGSGDLAGTYYVELAITKSGEYSFEAQVQ